ncbi:MAG: hypothetical protein QM698_00685 [Micropepsaceae bacterium]
MSSRTRVDFSIFCPDFYGVFVGFLSRQVEAQIGDKVDLFEGINPRPELEDFSGLIVVEDVGSRDGDYRSYFFEDVEFDNIEKARALDCALFNIFGFGADR